MRLLKATARSLGGFLGGDPAFAHNLSRSPFYTGADPSAYRWHCQHHRVDRLTDLLQQVKRMNGDPATAPHNTRQKFSSGRELLEAVKARRAEAESFKAMAAEFDGDLPSAEAMDNDRIDGVKFLWITEGRAARDETAFRYALAEAHRLRAAGERMSDSAIIAAYERAYAVAQAVGADGRVEELPTPSDRQTMARRVRGYIVAGKASHGHQTGPMGTDTVTSRERKALSTMGRKGGQKAAQRWKDRDSDYARAALEPVRAVQRRQRARGQTSRARILAFISQQYVETGVVPSRPEVMAETGLSRATVTRHLAALREAGMLPEQ